MKETLSTDEQLVSGPLDTVEQARLKCEEAANMLVAKHSPGGFWNWIGPERLRVFHADCTPFLTLEIESLQ
jgi:hypothetical protein